MILEQTEIKYKGKVVFERLVMSTGFKRVPKFFSENEACFLFLTKGAFHFRTPTNFLTFNESDAMLSKCGNYFMEIEKQQDLKLKKGDLFVVNKGRNHRVSSEEECLIMLIESKTTEHTGKIKSSITKSVDQQFY